MKVYVVTEGDYSDYHIVGVTTDRETAEAYCKISKGDWYEPKVEEYDTKAFADIRTVKPYRVIMEKDGTTTTEEEDGLSYETAVEHQVFHIKRWDRGWEYYEVVVLAEDEQHARKIAADYIAEKKWEEQGPDDNPPMEYFESGGR